MTTTGFGHIDRAAAHAAQWTAAVAQGLGTDDKMFACRALRAWLHLLRDRLTVNAAAKFAAQLPEQLRGVFYDGWRPARTPMKLDVNGYVERFAVEARIPDIEVAETAQAVTAALNAKLSPGQLAEAFAQLTDSLRTFLGGSEPPLALDAEESHARRLEQRMEVLEAALDALVRGLEEHPGRSDEAAPRAARRAHEILLAG